MTVDFTATAHRPWPMPRGSHMMRMNWHDLLFAHWPVPVDALRAIVPAGLELDLFDGEAWLGIVPFWMSGVRVRPLPPVPPTNRFPEINVRTYVTAGGKPGVYFFSLDAADWIAVKAARLLNLNYYHARMSIAPDDSVTAKGFAYESFRRKPTFGHRADFTARYGPAGSVQEEWPALDRWLTERYCLYSVTPAGKIARVEIHHIQWPLQPAAAEITVNTMTDFIGIKLPDVPPLLHFSKRIDVAAWWPERF